MARITTIIVCYALCGVCGLALPIWILGTPAIDNDFAKGWEIGLLSILATAPLAISLLLAVKRYAQKPPRVGKSKAYGTHFILGVALLTSFIISMTIAFRIMD